MSKAVLVLSPSKINIHLDVKEKRKDNFHEISSIFQMVSLYDIITVRSLKKNVCNIDGDFSIPAEQNIIYKAYSLFKEKTGYTGGFQVDVVKQIPEGAGLGGGSGNAAAALRAFSDLSGISISREDMFGITSCIGSDVPFFHTSAAAYVSGRGEVLTPINSRNDIWFVLVCPGIHVSTAKAYGWVDDYHEDLKQGLKGNESLSEMESGELVRVYEKKSPLDWNFFNSFNIVLSRKFAEFQAIEEQLDKSLADFTGLSGSGSTMFGVFTERRKAVSAVNELKRQFSNVFLAKALEQIPAPVYI